MITKEKILEAAAKNKSTKIFLSGDLFWTGSGSSKKEKEAKVFAGDKEAKKEIPKVKKNFPSHKLWIGYYEDGKFLFDLPVR